MVPRFALRISGNWSCIALRYSILRYVMWHYVALRISQNWSLQAIGAGRAECSSTRYVSDTSEWSQVSQRGIVKNFVAQYCNLRPCAIFTSVLWDPGSNLVACVNRAINDWPVHSAVCHLSPVVQAMTNNWACLNPALTNGHRLKRTPSNLLCLPEILFSQYALSWPACTDKPLGPGFELGTFRTWRAHRPRVLQCSDLRHCATVIN